MFMKLKTNVKHHTFLTLFVCVFVESFGPVSKVFNQISNSSEITLSPVKITFSFFICSTAILIAYLRNSFVTDLCFCQITKSIFYTQQSLIPQLTKSLMKSLRLKIVDKSYNTIVEKLCI